MITERSVEMKRKYLLGERGSLPVVFPSFSNSGDVLTPDLQEQLGKIPGVTKYGSGVRATWDAALIVARRLNRELPLPQLEADMTPSDLDAALRAQAGWDRFEAIAARMRPYQVSGSLFLARRAYALLCDPMRAGKTLTTIGAAVLSGAEKTLIVCPAVARTVWAQEVAKWAESEALVLEGRSPDSARRYCLTCDGRGRLSTGARCAVCANKNGQSKGYKIFVAGDPDRDLATAIKEAAFIIVNYELLVPQQATTKTGQVLFREELPGWAPYLANHVRFDVAIADEAHMLRGFETNALRKGHTRRERFIAAVAGVPQVWGVTGTPVFGYIRDLWGPLDAISAGAVTGPSRLPFKFHAHYCDGHRGEFGWVSTGRSPEASTELPLRLDNVIKLQRPRSVILSHMPAKVRQVVRVTPDSVATEAMLRAGKASAGPKKLSKLLQQAGVHKRNAIVENVVQELSEGNKVLVFSLLRANADGLYKAIQKATKSREWSTRMSQANLEMYLATGDSSADVRAGYARAFREHTGAAVFIATIDAVQVALSLRGAASVHFAELHWNPAAMLQAEDRPYEPGVQGLNIVYYVLENSIDDHVIATVLPKFNALTSVTNDEQAQSTKASFDEQTTLAEIHERLTAHVKQQMEEEEWLKSILE